ncbi:MAG: TolC family protein [Cytophagia bacterium]|nr:MAG: TolC family protein [Cytophagia bacterium]TAG46175.1 MAG: TolC family protein [Cytophagia bacterium]TAH28488.1 MAG: TolC family protein [Cytophagales bacterium]
MLKKILLFIFCFSLSFALFSQILTLDEVLQTALSQNLSIQVIKLDQQTAQNNHQKGNAGLQPTIVGNIDYGGSIINARQEFITGSSQNVNNAINRNGNIGVTMNWLIFNGLTGQRTYQILGLQKETTQLSLRLQIENITANTIINYCNIIQNKQNAKVLVENLNISQERVRIAKDRYELGAMSKNDYLRAQIDAKRDSANLIQQLQQVKMSKIALNQILNKPVQTEFEVSDNLPPNVVISYNQLLENLKTQNIQLLLQRKQSDIAQINTQITKGQLLPSINFNTGYNYANAVAGAGILRTNQNYGLNGRLTMTIPIFDGYERQRNIQNAIIAQKRQQANVEQTLLDAETALAQAFEQYQTSLQLLKIEQENVIITKQNLDITVEKFQLGRITALEFRDAQQTFLEIQNRVLSLNFQLKVQEINLLRISGSLVQ